MMIQEDKVGFEDAEYVYVQAALDAIDDTASEIRYGLEYMQIRLGAWFKKVERFDG